MTSINPVQTTVTQAPAFRGKNRIKDILDKSYQTLEQMNGFAYANKVQNPAELKETIMRETIAGHLDFAKGIYEYLSKNAAKKKYNG